MPHLSALNSVHTTRVHGPYNLRVVSTAREHGCHFGHPCLRAVDMGGVYRALEFRDEYRTHYKALYLDAYIVYVQKRNATKIDMGLRHND